MVNSVVGGGEVVAEKKIIMPWESYYDRAKLLNIKGSLTDILRDLILEIPQNESILLRKSSSPLEFSLDSHSEVIMKLLQIDPKLRELFRVKVPSKISEEIFWKNYFDRVEEIVDETLAKFANKKPIECKQYLAYHNNFIDELDKELEAEDFDFLKGTKRPEKQEFKVDEIKLLREQLEKALVRIETLEKRVSELEDQEPSEKSREKKTSERLESKIPEKFDAELEPEA